MEGPGSVRAARERLAKAQAIRAQQQEQQNSMTCDNRSQERLLVPRLQPGAMRSPVREEAPLPPSYGAGLQQSPQWPLPAAKPSLPILGSAVYTPATPTKGPTKLSKVESNSTINLSQLSNGYRSDELIPISLSEKSQSQSPNLAPLKKPRNLSQTTVSSLGTIPDFPVATIPPSPEQNSRSQMDHKAMPTNYQQFSIVSPIAEERGSRTSTRSYASSHAMPTVATDFYFEETPSDEEPSPKAQSYERPAALVRQASVGKRIGKPSMTAIKARSKPLPVPAESNRGAPGPSPLQLSSARYDPSRAEKYSQDLDSYLGDLEKGSDSDGSLRRVPRSMLSDRVGTRRPPNLDFEKPKATESRGSMTSLPELIRRATKLRSNLDHGRTASRLLFTNGWAQPDLTTVAAEKREIGDNLPSPVYSDTRTDWPSGRSGKHTISGRRSRFNFSANREGWSLNPAKSRRTLVTLVVVLIILIAAVIIIPVVLVVLPKQHAASLAASSTSSCARSLACTNSGRPLELADGTCACVCTEGFNGAACRLVTEENCSTVTLSNGDKVPLGTTIVPMVKAASNYSIPLDIKLVTDAFRKANTSCTNENALVELPGSSNAGAADKQSPRVQGATTTNGIIVAGTPTVTKLAAKSNVASALPAITAPSIPVGRVINSSAQEFAKIGILFVLQDSQQLATASRAQANLVYYMESISKNETTRSIASEIPLGNGYTINMWDYQIRSRNGTVYGNRR